MELQTLGRYLAGYVVGFSIFFLAIPYGLYLTAKVAGGPSITDSPIRFAVVALFGAVGLVFVVWSNAALLFRGRGGPTDVFNVVITPRTKHLVITGPYRYTRNPMVFGALCWYTALAVFWNSFPALGVVAGLVVVITFYLRNSEEKRLLRDFGAEYEEYCKRVAMIVPWPTKN
jgi:protein-S-isoprenylcysteine O-methyltransferase Ste14